MHWINSFVFLNQNSSGGQLSEKNTAGFTGLCFLFKNAKLVLRGFLWKLYAKILDKVLRGLNILVIDAIRAGERWYAARGNFKAVSSLQKKVVFISKGLMFKEIFVS